MPPVWFFLRKRELNLVLATLEAGRSGRWSSVPCGAAGAAVPWGSRSSLLVWKNAGVQSNVLLPLKYCPGTVGSRRNPNDAPETRSSPQRAAPAPPAEGCLLPPGTRGHPRPRGGCGRALWSGSSRPLLPYPGVCWRNGAHCQICSHRLGGALSSALVFGPWCWVPK